VISRLCLVVAAVGGVASEAAAHEIDEKMGLPAGRVDLAEHEGQS